MPTDTFVAANANTGTPTLEGASARDNVFGSILAGLGGITQAAQVGQGVYRQITGGNPPPATPPAGTGARGTAPQPILAPTDQTQKYLWFAAIALGALLLLKVVFKK